MTEKIPFSQLSSALPSGKLGFITFASFESRCRSIPEHLPLMHVSAALVFSSIEHRAQNRENVDFIRGVLGSVCNEARVSIKDPLHFADVFESWLSENVRAFDALVIDVTTFTHETLLVALRILDLFSAKDSVLLYVGAAAYGNVDGKNGGGDLWLSRGVTEVTSILGYPGELLPSQPLHLIVLVGFESERANEAIGQLQPARISLGLASREQSVSDELFLINTEYHQQVSRFAAGLEQMRSGVVRFEFSAVDPDATRGAVLEEAAKFSGHNVVVLPMNTKLSTVGCALAAFSNPSIQLCYARVSEYNVANYSRPGDNVRLFHLTPNP